MCKPCRLGLIDENEAYIVPMNFGYELTNDKLILYFHCATEGRKIDLLPKQKTVAFEMDTKHTLISSEKACSFSFLYQCIMGKGNLEIMENNDDKIYGLNKIMKHYSENDTWNFDFKVLDRLYVLKLTVAEWSCKEH